MTQQIMTLQLPRKREKKMMMESQDQNDKFMKAISEGLRIPKNMLTHQKMIWLEDHTRNLVLQKII